MQSKAAAGSPSSSSSRCSHSVVVLLEHLLFLLVLLGLVGLGLFFSCLRLLFQGLLLDSLRFHLVNGLDQHALVLVTIALGVDIEVVVQMLVNLLRSPVLAQESPQHLLATEPQNLRGHSRLPCTLPLPNTSVAALPHCLLVLTDTEAGMHLDCLADDETIFQQFPDIESRIRHGDLIHLV